MAQRDFEFELTDEQIEKLPKIDFEDHFMILAQIYIPRLSGYELLSRHLCIGKIVTGDLAGEAKQKLDDILTRQDK